MTRKDFELIAEVLRNAALDKLTREFLAGYFSIALARTNPRFDAARFIRAATEATQ